MDQKTAFEMLNLDAAASFADAKKAYRALAKKYHPDLAFKNPRPKGDTEAKMKEINLAFRYLAPLLRSMEPIEKQEEKIDRDTKKDSPVQPEKDTDFSFLLKLSRGLAAFFDKKTDVRAVQREPEKEKSGRPPAKPDDGCLHFEDVFRTIHPESLIQTKKRRRRGNKRDMNSPFSRYQRYMALKQKMKSGQSGRKRDMSIGRIDKIDPVQAVQPVNPVS